MCEQNYISYQISGHAFLPSSGIEIIGVFCSSFERFLENLMLPTPAMTVMRTDKRVPAAHKEFTSKNQISTGQWLSNQKPPI